MSNGLKQNVLDTYKSLREHAGLPPGELAESAISCICEIAEEELRPLLAINPYFPDHGIDHSVRMCLRLKELFSLAEPRPEVLTDEFLVLILSSILLHDVGMSQLTEKERSTFSEDINGMWRGRVTRPEHVRRSQMFVEEKLCTPVSRNKVLGWDNFWFNVANSGGYGQERFPHPAGVRVGLVVARIIQAHGDPLPIWLDEHGLDNYSWQTSDTSEKFGELWGEGASIVTLWLKAGGALLCFCDLCDICEKRFPSYGGGQEILLEAACPESAEGKVLSLIHWMGHKFSRVKLVSGSDGSVKVRCTIQNWPDVRSHMAWWMSDNGPIYPLRVWGNSSELTESIREYAGIKFLGVEVAIGAQNKEWLDTLNGEVVKPAFSSLSRFDKQNAAIGGEKPNVWQRFIRPFTPLAVGSRVFGGHLTEGVGKELPDFGPLMSIWRAGLCFERLYLPPREGVSVSSGIITVLADQKKDNVHDSFFAAMRLVIDIADKWYGECRANGQVPSLPLDITYKGRQKHACLLSNPRGLTPGILLVYPDDDLDYEELAKANIQGSVFVFFGPSESIQRLREKYPTWVKYDMAVDDAAMERFRLSLDEDVHRVVASLFGAKDCDVSRPEDYIGVKTPAGLIRKLYGATVGPEQLKSSLLMSISENNHFENEDESQEQAMGKLILLTVYELLRIDKASGVRLSTLREIYSEIAEHMSTYHIEKDPDAIIKKLSEYLRVDEERILERPKDHSYFDRALKGCAEESRKASLAQLAVYYRMQMMGDPYNLRSDIAERLMAVHMKTDQVRGIIKAIGCRINDGGTILDLREAVNLAYGMSRNLSGPGQVCSDSTTSLSFWKEFTHENRCKKDLIGKYEAIVFQASYQVFRMVVVGLPTEYSSAYDDICDLHPLIGLGMMEAIGSASEAGQDVLRYRKEWISRYVSKLCDAIRIYPRTCVMAYDIRVRYREGVFGGMQNVFSEMDELAVRRGWNRYCYYLHHGEGGGQELNIPTRHQRGFRRWVELRKEIQSIWDLSPLWEYRRTQRSSEVVERMQTLTQIYDEMIAGSVVG